MTDRDLSDEIERRYLIRAARQHLESLARAGLDRIPALKSSIGSLQTIERSNTSAAAIAVDTQPATGRPESEPGPVARPTGEPADERPRRQALAEPAHLIVPPLVQVSPPRDVPPIPSTTASLLLDESGFDTPPIAPSNRPAVLGALAAQVSTCQKCPHLAATRTQTVFGSGNPEARLMFIGEAPGADEDRTGQPFVGRAGQLLTDMITKGMGLSRDQVFIANVLKCRPPENRTPTPEECTNCFSYLDQQIAIVRPEFLCLLGKVAAQAVLNIVIDGMGKVRKKWHRYRGIPTIVTYHPSYLLRTPSAKKDAWEDLQILMKAMGLPIPAASSVVWWAPRAVREARVGL